MSAKRTRSSTQTSEQKQGEEVMKKARIVSKVLGEVAESITLPSPEQRVFDGVSCPLVLKCSKDDLKLADCVSWIEENQKELEALLAEHGTVLFRGFPLDSAEDLDMFVKAFKGWKDLSYTDSLSFAVRTHLTGRVCTTNDGKNGGLVFHHEQAQTPKWPSKVFFYCQNPASEGGGTGVCPSDIVLKKLEEKYPTFVKDCENKGVKYTAYLNPEPDPTKGVGRGWKSFFQRETKAEVEDRMKSLGYTWEWMADALLKCTSPKLSAVCVAPGTKKRVFFNQIVAQIANAKEWSSRLGKEVKDSKDIDLDRFMTFGDGSSMPVEVLVDAHKISDEAAVEVEWQKGDVALLDNMQVMHARRMYEGPRKVYASLVD